MERTDSAAFTRPQTCDARLGEALHRRTAAHPQKSGILPLSLAEDAFAARIVLARAARRSLDLQYYIWRGDTTGQLLWEALWQAAESGVRVRLLLDDANTAGLDSTLAALDAHPNIELRLFNPFSNRRLRLLDFVLDFKRVNRRMHNKSFTVDNQVAIVGGRNIGDEYFGASTTVGFQDLDVVAIGSVVQEVSSEFDLYWNSEFSQPAGSVVAAATPEDTATLHAGWSKLHQSAEAQRYAEAVRRTPLIAALMDEHVPMEWTNAHVTHDDPSKVIEAADRIEFHMLSQLQEAMGKPTRTLDLVSPYFVPGKNGARALVNLAQRGVRVRVLTNSLSATDVAPVHAGYSKYRKDLLKAGVTLFELKPGAALPSIKDADGDPTKGLPGSGSRGSTDASLHAKTFAVDERRVFVGSFNFDPRSARLNTEMGMVIDSPILAGTLSTQLDGRLPNEAYEVRLTSDGRSLEWLEPGPQGMTRHSTEPGTTRLKRLCVGFLAILPIEWML
ncbi:MAG: phospholipase D family protein [Variovorax sp.]|nr:MAG: phospholipase D family protein [Variovorax sp.]